MPTVPDVELVSSWEEVDDAAQAIKNGVQKDQMADGVKASLNKADGSIQKAAQAPATDFMENPVGIRDGKLYSSDSVSAEAKYALITLLEHVAYTDPEGQAYLDDLTEKLFRTAVLTSITAVYEQDRGVYNTDPLDVVKLDLTVTAHYSDGTSEAVTNYTLSGTLTPGTSTVTVTYLGKSTTIEVIVQDMMVNDILTLDGQQNTRAGHNSSATTWEDLSGNQNDFAAMTGSTPSWGTNYAAFDATNRAFSRVADLQGSGSNFTLEFVLVVDGDGSFHPTGAYQGMVISNCPAWADVAGQMRFYSYRDPSSNGISSRYGATSLGYTGALDSVKHIAYVFNGSTCVRYVNGEAAWSVNVTYPAGTKSQNWFIGAAGSDNPGRGYFNGKIFRVGISAAAMTASEIAERFAFFKTRFSIPV